LVAVVTDDLHVDRNVNNVTGNEVLNVLEGFIVGSGNIGKWRKEFFFQLKI